MDKELIVMGRLAARDIEGKGDRKRKGENVEKAKNAKRRTQLEKE